MAKDGADLPDSLAAVKDASQQVFPGEIYDFEYVPHQPGTLRLEASNSALKVKIVRLIEVQ